MQELRTKITDLEARVIPTTPLEELARREEEMKEGVRILTIYELECQEMYTQAEKTWNRWMEDGNLKNVTRN